MNATAEVVDAAGVELEPASRHTLFQTNDPVEVLAAATRVADALRDRLDGAGMVMTIGGNEHVLIDGWQTLGSMLGVSAHVVWSRPLDDGHGWEARAEARTLDGRVVGSAEAMVTRAERNWKRAEDYALRSMAQTRAMSKALRGPLGFVITLAGKSATPAEEVDRETGEIKAVDGQVWAPAWAAPINDEAINHWQELLAGILDYADLDDPADVADRIGNALHAHCNESIPDVAYRLTRMIAQAMTPTGGPPVPDPEPEDAA